MEKPIAQHQDSDKSLITGARVEAQNAVQWLARMALSYADKSSSGDDPGLRWCGASRKVVTPDVAPGVAVELSLPTLTFQFTENGEPSPHAFDVDGKSSTEVEAWLLVEMLHRDFDREIFSTKLPYQWSELMTGDEAKYSSQSIAHELEQLSDLLAEASDVLQKARAALGVVAPATTGQVRDPRADLLVCWPDSFDIGFVAPMYADATGADIVRIGFSLGEAAALKPGYFVRRESDQARSQSSAAGSVSPAGASQDEIVKDLVAAFHKQRDSAAN